MNRPACGATASAQTARRVGSAVSSATMSRARSASWRSGRRRRNRARQSGLQSLRSGLPAAHRAFGPSRPAALARVPTSRPSARRTGRRSPWRPGWRATEAPPGLDRSARAPICTGCRVGQREQHQGRHRRKVTIGEQQAHRALDPQSGRDASAGRGDRLAAVHPFAQFLAGLEERNGLLIDRNRAPVLGLRPVRASRCFTVKAPKPRNSTRSPRASAKVISSKIVATMVSTSCRAQMRIGGGQLRDQLGLGHGALPAAPDGSASGTLPERPSAPSRHNAL